MNNPEITREFVRLKRRIAALDAEAKELRALARTYEDAILANMMNGGVRSERIDVDEEPVTVAIRKQIWAKRVEGFGASDIVEEIERLGDPELRSMLTANSNSLSALLRETMANGDVLPGKLAAMIEADVRQTVSLTKGSRKESATSRALKGGAR